MDDVFAFLSAAEQLESTQPIEAATQYYEAVYLMRQLVQRMPLNTNPKIQQLLQEKILHYEGVASAIMRNVTASGSSSCSGAPSSVATLSLPEDMASLSLSPRSPLSTINHYSRDASSSAAGECNGNGASTTLLQQANAALSRAMDGEEGEGHRAVVLELYMRAAELYLQVLHQKDEASSFNREMVKQRLQQTLDRIEVLKSKHSKQPQSPSLPSAPGTAPGRNPTPLTAQEIEILKHSSLIASGLFLPWSDTDASALAQECRTALANKSSSSSSKACYTDPDGFLTLSSQQKERFHCWARPSEILRVRQQHHSILSSIKRPARKDPVLMIQTPTPYTIQQKFITDCSFIASLCICANYEQRFRKPLITSLLHPQDEHGAVLYNPQGKYMVQLWFNGVPRCVTIDDYLPIDKYGNLLCSQTTYSSNVHNASIELWVCLIEKAYMKLCGGYDFPGSNSGVDLFSLTGWIPERIHFSSNRKEAKDFETPAERVWERIYSANAYGDCLITVSTQIDITEEEATRVGLVTGHAYAVLAVVQTSNGTRLLQLKNPWAHKGWQGRFSARDREGWTSPSFRAEVGYDPSVAAQQDDGVFWIGWDDILRYFRNFHLSWNPHLFSSRLVLHGRWPKDQGPADDTFNVGENPQYYITFSDKAIQTKASFWILISRHVSKQEQEGEEVKDYLTIHVHRQSAKQERIWYPGSAGNCVLNGCYTNNPHALIRYDVQDVNDKHLALVLSQYKKSNDLNYSLSCYCTADFTLRRPEPGLEHSYKFSSTWTTYTAGGPIGQDQYPNNPQYSILVPPRNHKNQRSAATTIQITVSTTATTAVHALLVPVRSYGDRYTQSIGPPIIDTNKYRHGFVVSDRTVVPAGAYALVISNFHVGQTGFYNLEVFSNAAKLKIEKTGR